MKEIPCGCGKSIQVDDEDFDHLSKYTWNCGGNDAVFTSIAQGNGKYKKFSMPHLIMTIRQGEEPDHIFHDIHDNRKQFVRIVTPSQNKANRRMFRNNKSGRRGVSWSKKANRWSAQITIDGKPKWLGYFDNVDAAAKEYDAAALKAFGTFATLNFPQPVTV